jgi:predicted transposase YbfD/YdcC
MISLFPVWSTEEIRLNVTFREDACRVRKNLAARNLSLVRSLAMLRLDTAYPITVRIS